jgi:hypothetical protein
MAQDRSRAVLIGLACGSAAMVVAVGLQLRRVRKAHLVEEATALARAQGIQIRFGPDAAVPPRWPIVVLAIVGVALVCGAILIGQRGSGGGERDE